MSGRELLKILSEFGDRLAPAQKAALTDALLASQSSNTFNGAGPCSAKEPTMQSTGIPGVHLLADGRYLALATATVDGKRKRLRKTCATIRQATEAVAKLRANLGTQGVGRPSSSHVESRREESKEPAADVVVPLHVEGTVRTYGEHWAQKRRVRDSTRERYEHCLRACVYPILGDIPAQAVSRAHAEAWVAWAEEVEPPADDPSDEYSHETVQGWWNIVRDFLQTLAAELGLRDPTLKVTGPRTSHRPPKREQGTLTLEQRALLLASSAQVVPRRHAEVALLAYTGMRMGELIGLRWDCVDLDNNVIVVQRSVWNGKEGPTKTNHPRSVPIHPELRGLLIQLRPGGRKDATQSPLVFPGARGAEFRSRTSLEKPLRKAANAASFDIHVTPQVLRRTVNTLLVEAGIPEPVVRAMMGHASKRITNRYAGVHMDAKREAVERVFTIGAARSAG